MKIVQTENVKLAELYDHEKERALNEEKISDGPRRTRDEGVVALGRPPLPIYLDSSAYDLFANGKDVEVRQDGPRWAGRNLFPGRRCFISRGYSKANRRAGTVGQVWRQPTIYGLSDAVLGRAKLFVRGPRGLPAIAEPHPRFDPMLQVVAFEVLLDD